MKRLLAVIYSFTIITLLVSAVMPTALADSDAHLSISANKSTYSVGDTIRITAYATSTVTPYSRAAVGLWYLPPTSANQEPLKFISFDSASSDFPINNGQGVAPVNGGVQCVSMNRQFASDVTGRHYIGTFIYQALRAGSFRVVTAPELGCRLSQYNSDGDDVGNNGYSPLEADFTVANISAATGSGNVVTPSGITSTAQAQAATLSKPNISIAGGANANNTSVKVDNGSKPANHQNYDQPTTVATSAGETSKSNSAQPLTAQELADQRTANHIGLSSVFMYVGVVAVISAACFVVIRPKWPIVLQRIFKR